MTRAEGFLFTTSLDDPGAAKESVLCLRGADGLEKAAVVLDSEAAGVGELREAAPVVELAAEVRALARGREFLIGDMGVR